jgi:hypothetical protein
LMVPPEFVELAGGMRQGTARVLGSVGAAFERIRLPFASLHSGGM